MAGSESSSAQLVAVRPAEVAAPGGGAHERRLPVDEALTPLLPEGSIRRGTALAVCGHGSVTLATALAAEMSRRGRWVAAVGMADLGVSALAERGVDLQRWALIDLPAGSRSGPPGGNVVADVLGAVVGGFDLVLMGSGIRVGQTAARRLTARMREHGTSLICVLGADHSEGIAAGLQPEIRVTIEQARWTGIDDGHGRLLARQAEVTVGGRGAASRPRRTLMWLPSADGSVACAESGEASAFGDGLEDVRERRTG